MTLSEKAFENKIKAELKNRGSYFIKHFSNRNTKKGIPDILACFKGKFFGIEVKAENGKVSELQKYNIRKIRQAGGIGIVLYPKDFEFFLELLDAVHYSDEISMREKDIMCKIWSE